MRTFVRWGMVVVVAMAVMVSAAVRAGATVVVPADLGELTRDAQTIARGRVVAIDGRWSEGRRGIETLVTLEPESYLKGRSGETVQFKVPGGTLGRYSNVIVGAPRFAVGQRVIVFLGARGPMVPYVLGLNQGVFRIVEGDGGARVIPPPVLPTVSGPLVRGSAARSPATLADFEREVRGLLQESR